MNTLAGLWAAACGIFFILASFASFIFVAALLNLPNPAAFGAVAWVVLMAAFVRDNIKKTQERSRLRAEAEARALEERLQAENLRKTVAPLWNIIRKV